MTPSGRSTPPGLLRGFLQSYGGDLRGWVSGIVIRYVLALILLLAAGAGLIAATGVGVNALFHWLDTNYGLAIAYEVVIGALIVMGNSSWSQQRSSPIFCRLWRQRKYC